MHGRDATVRITEDGLLFAVDLVMVVTGKHRDDAGLALRRLPEEIFQQGKFTYKSFPGKGNGRTRLVKPEDAIELMMVLPGKTSKSCRKRMASVITRYLDGDLTLATEIHENNKIGKIKSYLNFAQNLLGDMETQERYQTSFGYVYAFESTAFPGLVKIGRSIDIERRLSQLNTACAPSPLVVVATTPSFNPTRDEKLAHEHFSEFRHAGEYFKVTKTEITEYFRNVLTVQFHQELAQKISSMNGCTI